MSHLRRAVMSTPARSSLRPHRLSLAVAAAAALFAFDATAARLALVVGNDNYQQATPLNNARNDAQSLARELEAAGFKVSVEKLLGGVFGTVRSTDPAAGTQVPKGSTVTIRVV